MGVYDTFRDGEKNEQVKAFLCNFDVYRPGDKVRGAEGEPVTVVCPGFAFVLLKDGKFVKITRDRKETYPPYIDKWGKDLESIDDFVDPFSVIVAKIVSDKEVT